MAQQGMPMEEPRLIMIKKLHPSVTVEVLRQTFGNYGPLTNVKIFTHKTGRSAGCASIEFGDVKMAQAAMQQLQGAVVHNKPMVLQWYSAQLAGSSPASQAAAKAATGGQAGDEGQAQPEAPAARTPSAHSGHDSPFAPRASHYGRGWSSAGGRSRSSTPFDGMHAAGMPPGVALAPSSGHHNSVAMHPAMQQQMMAMHAMQMGGSWVDPAVAMQQQQQQQMAMLAAQRGGMPPLTAEAWQVAAMQHPAMYPWGWPHAQAPMAGYGRGGGWQRARGGYYQGRGGGNGHHYQQHQHSSSQPHSEVPAAGQPANGGIDLAADQQPQDINGGDWFQQAASDVQAGWAQGEQESPRQQLDRAMSQQLEQQLERARSQQLEQAMHMERAMSQQLEQMHTLQQQAAHDVLQQQAAQDVLVMVEQLSNNAVQQAAAAAAAAAAAGGEGVQATSAQLQLCRNKSAPAVPPDSLLTAAVSGPLSPMGVNRQFSIALPLPGSQAAAAAAANAYAAAADMAAQGLPVRDAGGSHKKPPLDAKLAARRAGMSAGLSADDTLGLDSGLGNKAQIVPSAPLAGVSPFSQQSSQVSPFAQATLDSAALEGASSNAQLLLAASRELCAHELSISRAASDGTVLKQLERLKSSTDAGQGRAPGSLALLSPQSKRPFGLPLGPGGVLARVGSMPSGDPSGKPKGPLADFAHLTLGDGPKQMITEPWGMPHLFTSSPKAS